MTTDEYAGLELGHVVEQINSLNTARTQVAALFGTVNLAILGTALSTSKAGLFLFGAASVTLAGTVDLKLRALVVANTTRGIILQRRLSGNEPDTFLQAQPSRLTREALACADEKDGARRAERSRQLPILRVSGDWAPLMALVVVLEASAALLALTSAFSLF